MTGEPAQREGVAADVRCGQCGAPAAWDPHRQGLACASCGAVTPVDAPALPAGHTLQEASARWPRRPRRPGSLHLACQECGAVVDTAPGRLTATCPFCGSDAVAEVADDGRSFPPDGVVPFTVSREVAQARYRTWLGGLRFRPSALGRQAHLDSMAPVYVPFWAFDFESHTDWRADYATYDTDGPNGRELTPWKGITGEHVTELHGVLAQGSTGLPEALWRELEPFPLDAARGYDPRLLAGFSAEAARTQPLEAWQEVRARVEPTQRLEAEAHVPGDEVRRFSARASYQDVSFRQVLLPVWVAAYRYRGRVFRFLVNGATGEVQGRAPWSYLKIVSTVALVLAVLLEVGIWTGRVPLGAAAAPRYHPGWVHSHPMEAVHAGSQPRATAPVRRLRLHSFAPGRASQPPPPRMPEDPAGFHHPPPLVAPRMGGGQR